MSKNTIRGRRHQNKNKYLRLQQGNNKHSACRILLLIGKNKIRVKEREKQEQTPIKAVFHLLTIFVNVVDPEDIRICLTRFSNTFMCSSSTRKNATAVSSLVCSFCKFQTPSLVLLNASWVILTLGSIRTSNPHLNENRIHIIK